MMKPTTIVLASSLLLASIGCGDSKKQRDAALNDKKEQLEKLKAEQEKNSKEIEKLQAELSKIDTSMATQQKAKLVTLQTLQDTSFEHYIELQGLVDADNISYVTPRGQGGQVRAIYVKQGDRVRKGQLLMKLDAAIQQQNLVAAREALTTTRSQLSYAKDIYQRQKNLWDNHIGTEVQLLTARNNVTTLETQLRAQEENVKVVNEQLNTSNVYADVSGVADIVNIRVGEVFTGAPTSGIKIVNTSTLKVTGTIPENYATSVHSGTPVAISVPDAGKNYSSTVSFLSASVDPLSRGFTVEAKLPTDPALKPNQIALMRLRDYSNPRTVVIPVNTLQNDEKGKFVMVASKEGSKMLARKRTVNIGQLNNDRLEIKAGLQPGDVLITQGYEALYDGIPITTQ
jgi:membrane fusion protein, multidrug efflux system